MSNTNTIPSVESNSKLAAAWKEYEGILRQEKSVAQSKRLILASLTDAAGGKSFIGGNGKYCTVREYKKGSEEETLMLVVQDVPPGEARKVTRQEKEKQAAEALQINFLKTMAIDPKTGKFSEKKFEQLKSEFEARQALAAKAAEEAEGDGGVQATGTDISV